MKKLIEEFIFKFCRFGIIPEQAPLEIDLLTNASVKFYELDTINLDYDVTIAMQRNFTNFTPSGAIDGENSQEIQS